MNEQVGRYDAENITVLKGLEAVRRRPGMYVGGTDARALHHQATQDIRAITEYLKTQKTQGAASPGHSSRTFTPDPRAQPLPQTHGTHRGWTLL